MWGYWHFRKLAAQIANKQQKSEVEVQCLSLPGLFYNWADVNIVYPQITKPLIPVAPIRNETEDCIIIDLEDYKATGYSDVLMFVQHTEAMMEENSCGFPLMC